MNSADQEDRRGTSAVRGRFEAARVESGPTGSGDLRRKQQDQREDKHAQDLGRRRRCC